MRVAPAALAILLLGAAPAYAQEALVEGPGHKVGDGTVLHPSVGMETGVDSNVFREDTNPNASGILRVLLGLAVSSLPAQRLSVEGGEGEPAPSSGEPPKFDFHAGLNLRYKEYLSSNDRIQGQRDLAIDAVLQAVLFPEGRVSFAVDDRFIRDTRPTNFESRSNLNRDINHFKAALKYQPGGRALNAALRYENVIDRFESDDSAFANRIHHRVGTRVNWQFLPFTRFYFDGSLGIYDHLGDDTLMGATFKVSSTPLRLLIGADTVITERTTVKVRAGFAKGFYESGPDYTGPIGAAEFGYRYSPFGRAILGYEFNFRDSINANYYHEHVGKIGLDQQIRLVLLRVRASVRSRGYRGIPMALSPEPSRDDLIGSARVQLRYMYRDWLAVTAEYHGVVDETDFRYEPNPGNTDDPSYVRHEAVIGAHAAF